MGEPEDGGHVPVARLFALLDGVVAIAMTILALEIRLPDGLSGPALHEALERTGQQVLYFLLSVAVIGLFWHGHHQILSQARHVDGPLLWLNLAFLGLLTLIPFPTAALQDYSNVPVGPALYGLVLGLTSVVELIMWLHILRPGGPAARPIPASRRLRGILRCLMTAAVFLGSALVALVSPVAAMACWVLLVPLRLVESRIVRRWRSTDG